MKEYAREFYSSTAWKECREKYKAYRRGLCELCLKNGQYTPGEIVHHKIHISRKTINDPSITLNFDNLLLVCRQHHADLHNTTSKRYRVDEQGHVTAIE